MRGLAVALVLGGGLVLAAATAADWTAEVTTRDVGGVPIRDVETTPGTEFAAGLVRNGLLAVLGAVGLLVLRGLGKRIVGGLLSALGLFALVTAVAGWRAASGQTGDLTAAPLLAGIGALLVAGGGLLAAVRPGPPPALGPRYSLDEDEPDAEWDVASDEEPPTMPA